VNNQNILSEITAKQLSETIVLENAVAVLVLGACENHGDHMPFGSDSIMPYELAKRLAARCDRLLVLPPVPYGVSSHHKDFQMTISLEPETAVAVIRDILQSIILNKIYKILIINGHDGNIGPIEIASRAIKERNPLAVISCLESWWTVVGKLDSDLFEVWQGLGHGGEAETSAMLAVRPELVDMAVAPEQVVPRLPDNVRIYWNFSELTKTGATGAPMKATVEKGKKIIEMLENLLLAFIDDMDKQEWKYGTRGQEPEEEKEEM
jgi:creatinine amidohydrolase